MFNLIWADLYKLSKTAAIKILFGITLISAVVMVILAYLIPQGKISGNMTGIGFLFSDANVMSILGAVTAGIFICGDFENKFIHDAISGGIGRGAVIVSKAFVFFSAAALILLPYITVTAIALGTGKKFGMSSVAVGFLHLLTADGGKTFALSDVTKLIGIMAALFLVYMAQLSICIPFSVISKKPVLVVAFYYGFSILSAQLSAMQNGTGIIHKIFAVTPYESSYIFLTLSSDLSDILKAVAGSLVFILLMVIITCAVFRKAEVK